MASHYTEGDSRRRMQAKNILAQVRKGLENSSDSQLRLATSRKQLLIKRERVRALGRKVQLKRIDAGDAEATFLSIVRQFINNYHQELPSTLLDAYDNVERKRNDLGEIEEDYLQAERDLAGTEWTFMDHENVFYQFDLHSILPEEGSDDFVPSPDQLPTVHPPPPPPSFFPPLPENRSIGSTACPTPPPLPQLLSTPSPGPLNSNRLSDPEYFTVAAEVEGLRMDFERLRHKKAQHIDWEEEDAFQIADGEDNPHPELTASTMEYFDILHQLSDRKVKAQQLKLEEMGQHLQASTLTRRFSEPTQFFSHPPVSSTPMRRTQTESAASTLCNNPTTKDKIREWSLTYLKDNAVQKHLYLNTLEDLGVLDPEKGDWRGRAIQYWSQDSWSESGKGSEYSAASSNDTSHEAGSYYGTCATPRPTPSSSLQNLLEWEDYNPDYDEAIFTSFGVYPRKLDWCVNMPLPPSPSLLPETMDSFNTAIPSVLVTSHLHDQPEEQAAIEPTVAKQHEQQEASGLKQGSDSSLRKDSCHSMVGDHDKQPNHGDSELASETLQQNVGIMETAAESERYEELQQPTLAHFGDQDPSEQRHETSVEDYTKAASRPSLNIQGVQTWSAPSTPLGPSAHTQLHESIASLRPTSERKETRISLSTRMKNLLFRGGHGRSKSTSFLLGYSSLDGIALASSTENGHSLSS
jgi:hypothetical protein